MENSGENNGKVVKSDLEEEVITNESDDLDLFIRKTQLQNVILKRITENLTQSPEKSDKY